MEVKKVIKALSALDLSEKDVAVYLSLLVLGTSTVRQITKKTELNRSSLYVVLDRLLKKGFVSSENSRAVKRYTAAPPERLALNAKERSEQHSLALRNLTALTSELKKIHKGSKFKPKVTIIEGKKGLEKGFADALYSIENEMRVFSSTKEIFQSLPEYLPVFVSQRLVKGLKMYGIYPDDESARQMLQNIPNSLDDITLIPTENFKFPADLAIYDNKTTFMSHHPAFCVFIESNEIAEVMKVAFNLAQVEAKRLESIAKLI